MQIRDRIRELKRVPAKDLRPNPKNWRTHPKAQQDALRGVLAEVGYADALLARELPDGGLMLVDGHLRAETTPDAMVPVLILDVTEEEADKILATLDPLAGMAEANDEKLAALLATIDTESEALQRMLDEVAKEAGIKPPEVAEDEVPEPPKDPITKPGDLWLLGEHRLLCGDSTKAEDVARVMDGERAVACITDPPYSVNYEESHKTRGGDATVHGAYHEADINPTDLLEFMGIVPCDLLILSYSVNRHIFVLADQLRKHKWEVRKELVWVKDTFSFWMGAAYQQRHEPIWICTRNGASFSGNVESNQSTVLEFKRPKAHELHPTAKPVELWGLLISNHTSGGELLYEPFCGSGTTIIAAEQLGRKCYGIEISPAYVDVCVERWQKMTGGKATRANS